MCKKNNFQNFVLFAIKRAVLSVFWKKEKGLGILGVRNDSFEWKHTQKTFRG